jgi:UDPglucose 6-dehydrogenase
LDLARLRKELKDPIIIDGRNLYDPQTMAENGFTYYSVGRPAASAETLQDAAASLIKIRQA